jgi:hypothetical protein
VHKHRLAFTPTHNHCNLPSFRPTHLNRSTASPFTAVPLSTNLKRFKSHDKRLFIMAPRPRRTWVCCGCELEWFLYGKGSTTSCACGHHYCPNCTFTRIVDPLWDPEEYYGRRKKEDQENKPCTVTRSRWQCCTCADQWPARGEGVTADCATCGHHWCQKCSRAKRIS